jgi:hypothetical protein
MSKLKCQIKLKALILEFFNLKFGIRLTFACLREAASAKAGILSFEI